MLGDGPKTKPLKEDVDEMQHMLEDYMAFVRGDGGEKTEAVTRGKFNPWPRPWRAESHAALKFRMWRTTLKPISFRRLITNLVTNAMRYGNM